MPRNVIDDFFEEFVRARHLPRSAATAALRMRNLLDARTHSHFTAPKKSSDELGERLASPTRDRHRTHPPIPRVSLRRHTWPLKQLPSTVGLQLRISTDNPGHNDRAWLQTTQGTTTVPG